MAMEGEVCGICGGDGRIGNSFGGSQTTCPGCHGTGRKADTSTLFRDVTKTKASHHRDTSPNAAKADKNPSTFEGVQLAKAVNASGIGADAKARLILEIVDHEATHGRCTKTFLKKIRKQIGATGG
jgi:hypothetical protein